MNPAALSRSSTPATASSSRQGRAAMASARAGSPGGGSWRRVAAAQDALLQLAVSVGKTTTLVIASRPTGDKTISTPFVTFALCPPGTEEQREHLCLWVTDAAQVRAAVAGLSRAPRLRRLAGLVLRAGNVPDAVHRGGREARSLEPPPQAA